MAVIIQEKFQVHVTSGSELDKLFHKWRVSQDLQDGIDEFHWMRDHGYTYRGYTSWTQAHVYEFDSEDAWWHFRMSWLS